jgi:hypothetical protein
MIIINMSKVEIREGLDPSWIIKVKSLVISI